MRGGRKEENGDTQQKNMNHFVSNNLERNISLVNCFYSVSRNPKMYRGS